MASRSWFFKSSDGLRTGPIGAIAFDYSPALRKNILSGISVIKPATLVLSNVNQSYNGTYRFDLITATEIFTCEIIVFVASKFDY